MRLLSIYIWAKVATTPSNQPGLDINLTFKLISEAQDQICCRNGSEAYVRDLCNPQRKEIIKRELNSIHQVGSLELPKEFEEQVKKFLIEEELISMAEGIDKDDALFIDQIIGLSKN